MIMIRLSQIPGSRFVPTDVELVNILRSRESSYVLDIQDLYEKEPWLLQHVRHAKVKNDEWYYFVKRNKPPGSKDDSTRPSRKVAGSGRWKTVGKLAPVENKNGVKVGSVQTINFRVHSQTKNDEVYTGWMMHEFLLDTPGFQEVALCRIRFNLTKKYAQYAPRLRPIVIEHASTLVDNNLQNQGHASHNM